MLGVMFRRHDPAGWIGRRVVAENRDSGSDMVGQSLECQEEDMQMYLGTEVHTFRKYSYVGF